MRIGFGYDVHRLKRGRRCVLCGVEIPCELGPDGHSDADVPVHALIDALLGASALGDIGKHFPESDSKWKDANSIDLLTQTYSLIRLHGYTISNADITIVLETPRLFPYIDQMRESIAVALMTEIGNISVKATTEEGLGFTGDGTGISSSAVVLLVGKDLHCHSH